MNKPKTCPICGNIFERPTGLGFAQWEKRMCCSRSCGQLSRNRKTTAPYHYVRKNGKHILKHRSIMEDHLGRKLGRFEIVHHINGNKKDNRIENLELISPKKHSVKHNQKYPIYKICEVCGETFIPHKTKRKRAKTCSVVCRNKLLSLKNKRPLASRSIYRNNAYPCEIAMRK